MESATTTGLGITLLRGFHAEQDGVDLLDLHERHAREILAYLAVSYGQFIPNETLLHQFIPGASSAALRQSVAHLRACLGNERDRVETYNGQVRLLLSPTECDLAFFEAALQSDHLKQAVAKHVDPGQPHDDINLILVRNLSP